MDLREYDHIAQQPDTWPRSTLRKMRRALESIGSSGAPLIDKILRTGYLEPPLEYKYHGFYRIILTRDEQEHILKGLERARDELAARVESPLAKDLQDELVFRRRYVDGWIRTMTEEPIPWEIAKARQVYFDLRHADLLQFQAFIFDHAVPERTHDENWYFDSNLWIDYDEEINADLFMKLFKGSRELLDKYPRGQIEQGCWAMMSDGLDGDVHQLIWDSKIDTQTKERLIESMFDLYANLFSTDPLETAGFMWWDSLAYDFNPMNRADPEGNEEHRRIRDAMFRTLTRILQLEPLACQRAALHGLNHVLHPDTETVIDEYLAKSTELTEDDRKYALACSHGKAL